MKDGHISKGKASGILRKENDGSHFFDFDIKGNLDFGKTDIGMRIEEGLDKIACGISWMGFWIFIGIMLTGFF